MDDSDFKNLTVSIIGLGLMGGSLAAAIHAHAAQVIGWDADSAARTLALNQNMIHRAAHDLNDALAADLIILATPPRIIIQQLRELQSSVFHPSSSVILDLGSTKTQIVNEMQKLPALFDPLGGHPMCGKEVSGLAHADAHLFRDKKFILTPLARTSERALKIAHQLIAVLGAHPIVLDPAAHDQQVALISHLPYLASIALMQTASPTSLTLAASGFKDTTRLAASDLTMMTDILTTNRAEVINALHSYRAQLDSLLQLLSTADAATLREALQPTQAQRRKLFSEQ